MCFFVSFVPATFWLVVGYFVFFAATKSQGGLQVFGRVLAIWIFIIAAFIPLMGLYVTVADLCPAEAIMEKLQSG
jgi:hypothetical protein